MAGRILVLDDEENYAEMLKDLLCEHNYRVDMATRPERAVSQLEEIPYDLVISDYKMPVMDGADFLKKSRELYPNLPFILVSGLMNTPELVKVANMSVTLVMEKPLNTEAFLEQVARFSTPMSDDEKSGMEVEQSGVEETDEEVVSIPSDPRFFSARSSESKSFLLNAWSIASKGNAIYLMQSKGGDGELVAKDLSQWLGNGDIPLSTFDLSDSIDDALGNVRETLFEFDRSNTVVIRLKSIGQLSAAKTLAQRASEEIVGAGGLFLVFVLSVSEEGSFKLESSDLGVVLPPLSMRPSDLACYAKRFAKIAAERAGKHACAEFSPEAAYELMCYGWPGDYKELQVAIMTTVSMNDADKPIARETLLESLGQSTATEALSSEKRLKALMLNAQKRYLEQMMESQAMTPAALAKALELGASVESREDIDGLPLILGD